MIVLYRSLQSGGIVLPEDFENDSSEFRRYFCAVTISDYICYTSHVIDLNLQTVTSYRYRPKTRGPYSKWQHRNQDTRGSIRWSCQTPTVVVVRRAKWPWRRFQIWKNKTTLLQKGIISMNKCKCMETTICFDLYFTLTAETI